MKLLIVDDHPVLREGLAALLGQTWPDTEVLQACDAEQAFARLADHADLDAVVLDLLLPGGGGVSTIAEFGRRRPDLPVVVLSSSEDPRDARDALAQGALGYVPKSASQVTLLSAIRLVLNGELYVPPLMLGAIAGAAAQGRLTGDGAPDALLTERQVDVLKLLAEGLPNKTIAGRLGLSEKTVKAHVTSIFRALGVINRTQAANAGRTRGLI